MFRFLLGINNTKLLNYCAIILTIYIYLLGIKRIYGR